MRGDDYHGEEATHTGEPETSRPATVASAEAADRSSVATSSSETPPAALADETVTVAPDGSHEFSPAALDIGLGDTVTFEWDSSGHTVTVDSQPEEANWAGIDTTQSEGHVHTHTFDVAGTYEYYCQPHQEHMQGTVTVSDGVDVSASGETIGIGGTATLSVTADTADQVTVDHLWTDWQVSVDDPSGASNTENRVDQAGEVGLTWDTAQSSATPTVGISPPEETYVGGTYAVRVIAESGESSATDIATTEIDD